MKKLSSLFIFFVFALFGCTESNFSKEPQTDSALYASLNPKDTDNAIDLSSPKPLVRKLIKQGTITFETEDLATTKANIVAQVDQFDGYIASDRELNSYDGTLSNTLLVRVPTQNFENLLAGASKGVKEFDKKSITSKDVTEEFLDIEARLNNKKELEQRYLEILKKAKNVTEILEVEKQIGILREEIESTEGRLNYLKDQTSFSTLNITFYKKTVTKEETGFGHEFKKGFSNGWHNLIWFFVGLANVWPFILLGIVGLFGFRSWRRLRLQRKRTRQP